MDKMLQTKAMAAQQQTAILQMLCSCNEFSFAARDHNDWHNELRSR
jgi:hypothetical protein